MIEQISSRIHQYKDWIHEHREEHHRKALQSMVEQLNQWDYQSDDLYATTTFLGHMLLMGERVLEDYNKSLSHTPVEKMPKELVPICDISTEISLYFQPWDMRMTVSGDRGLNFDLYNDRDNASVYVCPVSCSYPPGYLEKYANSLNECNPRQTLELMGKTIAAAASYELSQY